MPSPSRSLMVAAAIACLFCGCTRPAVTPKPPGFQDKANSVRDWDDVARQIADGMMQRGLLPDPLRPQSATPFRYPYYINLSAPDSPFLHQVREALRGDILASGGTVALSPVGAMVVNLDVDVLRWGGPHRPAGGANTILGLAAGTGILLANAAPISPAGGFGIAAGTGLALDALYALSPHTNVEAVWQASVMMGDRLAFDIRRPIYVGERDVALYASSTRLSPMSSPGTATAVPPVRLRYDP